MGWDFCDNWKTKRDVVTEQLRPGRWGGSFFVEAHKSTKSGLWMVVKNADTGLRGIFFDRIMKDRGTWGVKSMDESMGPYYYDCPKKFLDLVEPAADCAFMFNLAWRAQWAAENYVFP